MPSCPRLADPRGRDARVRQLEDARGEVPEVHQDALVDLQRREALRVDLQGAPEGTGSPRSRPARQTLRQALWASGLWGGVGAERGAEDLRGRGHSPFPPFPPPPPAPAPSPHPGGGEASPGAKASGGGGGAAAEPEPEEEEEEEEMEFDLFD